MVEIIILYNKYSLFQNVILFRKNVSTKQDARRDHFFQNTKNQQI